MNELTVIETKERELAVQFQELEYEQKMMTYVKKQAELIAAGGAMPSSFRVDGKLSIPRVMMAIQYGREIGLSFVKSLSCFYFVNDKISMYGATVIAQVLRAGHKVKWGECNEMTATVTVTRGDDPDNFKTITFTREDAKKAGIYKNVHEKYPQTMLEYRAFGMAARKVCPDALEGIPIKEEIEGTEKHEFDGVAEVLAEPEKEFDLKGWHATLRKTYSVDEIKDALREVTGKQKMVNISEEDRVKIEGLLAAGSLESEKEEIPAVVGYDYNEEREDVDKAAFAPSEPPQKKDSQRVEKLLELAGSNGIVREQLEVEALRICGVSDLNELGKETRSKLEEYAAGKSKLQTSMI